MAINPTNNRMNPYINSAGSMESVMMGGGSSPSAGQSGGSFNQAGYSYDKERASGGILGWMPRNQGYVTEEYYDEGYYPMAEFEMPDFGAFIEAMGKGNMDFGKIYAQQAEAAAASQGRAQVSALYAAKFDAADKAINEVNQQVADEMAHAKLVGLDYNVDEASKQARINDIFANYWSEADESNLSSLIGQYGDSGYSWDLPVKRGTSTADKAKEKTPGESAGAAVKAKTKGAKLTTEENPLGSSSVLG